MPCCKLPFRATIPSFLCSSSFPIGIRSLANKPAPVYKRSNGAIAYVVEHRGQGGNTKTMISAVQTNLAANINAVNQPQIVKALKGITNIEDPLKEKRAQIWAIKTKQKTKRNELNRRTKNISNQQRSIKEQDNKDDF